MASGLITPDQLRSQAWRRLFYDVYVDARAPDTHKLRCQGLSLRLPDGAVIAGRSAAQLWDAKIGDPDDPIEVLSAKRMRSTEGVRARQGELAESERAVRYGVPLMAPLHAAWDLATRLPIVDAVTWVDALAHARRLTTGHLVAHCQRHIGDRGNVVASKVLPLCDGRAESPPESRLRLGIISAGLPPPVPQWWVVVNEQFVARVDLAWPELRLAVEYDGQWHADLDQLARDRERIRNLNAAGWYVYPVTRNDMRDMDRLVREIARLLRARSRQV